MKSKILIVDDEKPLRDTLARWFRAKYDCLTAPDAAEALRLIGEHPDLALMISDVRMPGEDGVELLKKAKAANPSMACILLTAYGTVDLAVEAMKHGADDFFQKHTVLQSAHRGRHRQKDKSFLSILSGGE